MQIDKFIGQKPIITDLHNQLLHAGRACKPLPHTMFYGSAGLGKTTLAEILANCIGSTIYKTTGRESTPTHIDELISHIGFQDILFIDEIHSVPVNVSEILYGPMQDITNVLVYQLPQDYIAFRDLQIPLFTVVGATTSAGNLPKPLRDRIILAYRFSKYTQHELVQILVDLECPVESAKLIAKYSRGTPRVAINYFIRMRNEVMVVESLTKELCQQKFDRWGIVDGFTVAEQQVLEYLKNGIASENQIVRALDIDPEDYHNMIEPYLLERGKIQISSRGRSLR